MKYVFTTLAIGQKYFDSSIKFINDLNKISKSHKVLIVTDCDYTEIPNTTFIKFDERNIKIIQNNFNYNLKYIPIMESIKTDSEFVIFFDADWELNEYSENKFISFLSEFSDSNYDFIYERPHNIGHSKRNLHQCFWKHKIEPYGLMNTNFYDEGQVVNEQFMIFKNNDKLKIFVDKWQERNTFGIEKDIWAFAEGLEIGMSAIDAKMNMDWKRMFELKGFFKFISNSGQTYIRF